MAQKLPRPIEDYLIGKYDTGICCYLITREAYQSWSNHGATVKHSCVNYNRGQDLIQYPLQQEAKYKAFEFNKMLVEWQPILTQGNLELAKQLCAYHSKPKGKFDHIKPDEIGFTSYKSMVGKAYFTSFVNIKSYEEWIKLGKGCLQATYWRTLELNSLGTGSNLDRVVTTWPNLSVSSKADLRKMNPELYKYFEDFYAKSAAVKTESTPDQYYIAQGICSEQYYFYLRSNSYSTGDTKCWVIDDMVGCSIRNTRLSKKFPQLSSEVKQELQKQNPERYKEWEDFYVRKYPNMQRLKPIQPTLIWGDDLTNWLFQCYGRGHYVFFKHKNSPDIWCNRSYDKVDIQEFSTGEKALNGWATWDKAPSVVKYYMVTYNKPISDKFEQYYTELEQKKVAFHQGAEAVRIAEKEWDSPYWDTNLIKDPKDYVITSTEGGWGFMPLVLMDDGYKKCRLWANPKKLANVQYRDKLTLDTMTKATCLADRYSLQDVQKAMCKSNLTLYEIFSQVGSDLDIDEKAMEADYQSKIINLATAESEKSRGDKRHSSFWMDEAGPTPKDWKTVVYYNTQYMIGYDPYKPVPNEGCISVWGKDLYDKLVNRMIELQGEQSYKDFSDYWKEHAQLTPKQYYDMLMQSPSTQGVIWTKSRRVGQSQFYKDVQEMAKYYGNNLLTEQYSPNTKTNNHEIINVPRKTITITSGQKCTGNSISSFRRAPAVTEKYIGNRQEPIRGKESSRSCKIS